MAQPAEGVRVSLFQDETELSSRETGPDGRIGDLGNDALQEGTHRLVFHVADYLARHGRTAPFLQRVTIEFHVDLAQTHYHVPLLMTPFACTSYRGS